MDGMVGRKSGILRVPFTFLLGFTCGFEFVSGCGHGMRCVAFMRGFYGNGYMDGYMDAMGTGWTGL